MSFKILNKVHPVLYRSNIYVNFTSIPCTNPVVNLLECSSVLSLDSPVFGAANEISRLRHGNTLTLSHLSLYWNFQYTKFYEIHRKIGFRNRSTFDFGLSPNLCAMAFRRGADRVGRLCQSTSRKSWLLFWIVAVIVISLNCYPYTVWFIYILQV